MNQMDVLKKKNGNKYLILDSTDKKKEVLVKYKKLRDGVKNSVEKVNMNWVSMENKIQFR